MILLPSAARSSSGSSEVTVPPNIRAAAVYLDVTAAATDASDTLNVRVQHSPDGGSAWDDFISYTQVVGDGGAKAYVAQWSGLATVETEMRAKADGTLAAGSVLQGPVGSLWRVKHTIVEAGTVQEVWTLDGTGAPAGGNYKIGYNGQQSANIAYNAVAATIQTAINAITGLGDTVTVAAIGADGTLTAGYTITFATAGAKPYPLVIGTENVTGGDARITQTTPGVSNASFTFGVYASFLRH